MSIKLGEQLQEKDTIRLDNLKLSSYFNKNINEKTENEIKKLSSQNENLKENNSNETLSELIFIKKSIFDFQNYFLEEMKFLKQEITEIKSLLINKKNVNLENSSNFENYENIGGVINLNNNLLERKFDQTSIFEKDFIKPISKEVVYTLNTEKTEESIKFNQQELIIESNYTPSFQDNVVLFTYNSIPTLVYPTRDYKMHSYNLNTNKKISSIKSHNKAILSLKNIDNNILSIGKDHFLKIHLYESYFEEIFSLDIRGYYDLKSDNNLIACFSLDKEFKLFFALEQISEIKQVTSINLQANILSCKKKRYNLHFYYQYLFDCNYLGIDVLSITKDSFVNCKAFKVNNGIIDILYLKEKYKLIGRGIDKITYIWNFQNDNIETLVTFSSSICSIIESNENKLIVSDQNGVLEYDINLKREKYLFCFKESISCQTKKITSVNSSYNYIISSSNRKISLI